ncbi:hypothetical protein HRW16_35720, partial [Streptomyces lunaelactis]|uniref:hypothetical protein n=1 Tax=Streptomyces lunaelactis TaxID=1535768 RepID=UPI001584AAFA
MSESEGTLLWVAVPGGRVSGDSAVLRALIVPRLRTAGLVADSVMRRWPDQLAGADIEVTLRSEARPTPRPVSGELHHEADPEVWESFFGTETDMKVTPYHAPDSYDYRHVEHTAAQAKLVTETYTEAAKKVALHGSKATTAQSAIRKKLRETWLDDDPGAPTTH